MLVHSHQLPHALRGQVCNAQASRPLCMCSFAATAIMEVGLCTACSCSNLAASGCVTPPPATCLAIALRRWGRQPQGSPALPGPHAGMAPKRRMLTSPAVVGPDVWYVPGHSLRRVGSTAPREQCAARSACWRGPQRSWQATGARWTPRGPPLWTCRWHLCTWPAPEPQAPAACTQTCVHQHMDRVIGASSNSARSVVHALHCIWRWHAGQAETSICSGKLQLQKRSCLRSRQPSWMSSGKHPDDSPSLPCQLLSKARQPPCVLNALPLHFREPRTRISALQILNTLGKGVAALQLVGKLVRQHPIRAPKLSLIQSWSHLGGG